MKTPVLILLLTISFCTAHSQQRFTTIKPGDFFSDSVWMGGIQPSLSSDSIYVETYLNFYQGIILSGTCFMYISPAGTLCGVHNINLFDSAYLWINGSVYMDSMLIEATVLASGYLDGLEFDLEAGSLTDSCGVLYIHSPPQLCASDSFAKLTVDTTLNIWQNGGKITMKFDPTLCGAIDINFGDGDSTITNGYTSVTHTYATYGTYTTTVSSYCIACGDTATAIQYRTIEFDSACDVPSSFSAYPNPCTDYFYFRYMSCTEGIYTLPIYDMLGQTIKYILVDNTGTPVKVNTDELASGVYLVRVPPDINSEKTVKLVVLH